MSMDTQPPVSFGHEGALAEFAALRQEIDSRASRQHGLFALHVTAAGAIFSFALSGPGRVALLLIVPFSTYLFCARYVMEDNAIRTIGQYIQEDLSDRVPGGLRWERWRLARPSHLPKLEWAHPSFVAFPCMALVALIWTAPATFTGWPTVTIFIDLGFAAVWLLGLVAAWLSLMLTVTDVRMWLARQTTQTG